jgi:tellurite methyltransferase
MSAADRERWNRRYRGSAHDYTPCAWLVERAALIRPRRPGGRALDLACGPGRNALYLARLGYQVDAWDISDVALDRLRGELARLRRGGRPLDVSPRQVDLDEASLPATAYELVLDIDFLQRRLFPYMAAALEPGGLLVVRTLLRRRAGEERNPVYLLEPGELRGAFADLEQLEYAEDAAAGRAALVARRPCAR